jgi:hypothetical protein
MIGKDVIFNLDTHLCGIASANCPSFRRSPKTSPPAIPFGLQGKSLETPNRVRTAELSSEGFGVTSLMVLSLFVVIPIARAILAFGRRGTESSDQEDGSEPLSPDT